MKHAARKTTSVLLSTLLLGSSCLMGVSADEINTDPVSVDTENTYYDSADKTYHVALTINETAGNDVTVELSDAIVDTLYTQVSYWLPGDSFQIQVTITNNSDKVYKYADNSFTITPAKYGVLSDFIGYDGEAIPFAYISGIATTSEAIYKNLFGKSQSGDITPADMFGIYDKLAEKNYTGDNALTEYMLDYYNDLYHTSYATWNELVAAKPSLGETFAGFGDNGLFTMSLSYMESMCEAHPEMAPYVMYEVIDDTTNPDDPTVRVQFKWPEQDLAAFSYNFFYQDLFSAAYGMEECDQLNPNRNTSFTRTRGVGDYADSSSDLYQQTNGYFASLENADSLATGESITFDMKLAMDGPYTGNGYMNYKFSFANSIGFTRIDTTYQVVHQYYTSVDGGDYELDGTVVSDPISGMVGDVINAADIEKLLQYGDNEYTYYGDNGSISLVLDASTNLVITEYHRDYTTPVDPGDPDDPNNPDKPVDPDNPGEDINDPDIPTTGGTDTNTGDDTNSDNNDDSIDDDETPLAPATGDTSNLAVVLTVVVMVSALAVVVLRKKAHN